jgi:glycosyltransferase involved in cell wall biosynthesis
MKPKISVVTATYNRRDFLPRCIEGVAAQDYPAKEHIIIDGGSTDGAVELLREYAARYPHVRWISEKDEGISDALNKGMALATGDVIGVNGDDDFYVPGTFEVVADAFAQNPSAGVVSGHCDHIGNDGAVIFTSKAAFVSRREMIECWKHWARTTFLPAPSTFFRREVLDAVGGFDVADRYAMDYHHWIKITEKFEVKIVDRVFAKFRYDEGTVSYSASGRQAAEMYAISRRYWGRQWSPSYYHFALSYFDHFTWRPFKERVRNSLRYRLGLPLKG